MQRIICLLPVSLLTLQLYGPPAPAPGCYPNGTVISCRPGIRQ